MAVLYLKIEIRVVDCFEQQNGWSLQTLPLIGENVRNRQHF